MIIRYVIGLLSLSIAMVGCSNQEPISINNTAPTTAAYYLASHGLATIMTNSTSKYVSNDATGILKANSTKVGPLQQFYIRYNIGGTYSIQSLSNSKYVTVQDNQTLAVLNQTIDNTNEFSFKSASSLDPEKFWINYQNAYQGWLNIGESYITLGLNQTTYKVVMNKIYASSGIYNSSDYSYSWNSIYLEDVRCGGISGSGVMYRFYTNGTIPSGTTISFYIDNILQFSEPFSNGMQYRICPSINGINQHNVKIQFSNPVSLYFFHWDFPTGTIQ